MSDVDKINFEAWAGEHGYDTAHAYDTERRRWVFWNPMTADLWVAWQARAALAQQQVPQCTVVDRGFRWVGEHQHHVPQLVVEFEPVPVNGGGAEKGWKDRDALAAMLASAPPAPQAEQKGGIEPKCGNRDYCGRFPFCGCGGPESLPERDTTKPAEQQGLLRKFDVRRTDGSDKPGGKHYGCEYFVLDVNHDPHAKPALAAYAKAVEATHPTLADDMRDRYELPAEQPRQTAAPAGVVKVCPTRDAACAELPAALRCSGCRP